ncbi:DNA repair protein RadA [Reinekea thalattae]|uniref:DNA repair protein RadA n=1 Tax=Reinekea thalattae TaxID=2593301 RepID=A0A5C8Z9M1_9GAMM|nr:DNA repair protein RadA [Reinekea thalattae]TXR54447.1 DNA repair protein RadA [Reinekea thalattae]
MAKAKVQFVCTSCGADYTKWQGQCGECKEWNTLKEFREAKSPAGRPDFSQPDRFAGYAGAKASVQALSDVDLNEQSRLATGIGEFDRVLGGGMVAGSAILIGGHPGAGKSTLLLQTLCHMAKQHSVLYVTGEESMQQVAMRAQRLNLPRDDLKILSETSVESITEVAKDLQPKILVIDSIQVMHAPAIESAPGSVSQVRESAAWLTRYAKQTGTILVLVGHVTKDGSLAGPKVLEHMIDASVMLESSGDSRFRTLRAIKNRFGAVNELGVFAMLDTGLKEVKNPSSIFLNRSAQQSSGSVVTVVWEGTRPMLIEFQALVDGATMGHPRRVAVGLDTNRLNMMLAILNRHGGIFTGDQDVFINVVGGVRVNETAADLASLLAILSSLKDKPISADWVAFGELGLNGEVRPVPNGQERIIEAAKHGFKRAIVPIGNKPKKTIDGIQVIAVTTLAEALQQLREE